MIDPQFQKRIRGDFAYQSEKVQNLMRAVYRDPDVAWERWKKQNKERRFEVFQRNLNRKPQILGRLRGSLRLNFWKSPDYRDAENALEELHRVAVQWRSAQIQVEQMQARIDESERRKKSNRSDWKLRSQQRLQAKPSKEAQERER